jgi:hypothetical protein
MAKGVWWRQILLTAGASMEVRDEDGGIPLHDACAGGRQAGQKRVC